MIERDQQTAKPALRAKFITCELPEDFVADLRAARETLATANQGEAQEGVENTAGIGEQSAALPKTCCNSTPS